MRRLEKSFDAGGTRSIHANTFQHVANVGAVVQCHGFVGALGHKFLWMDSSGIRDPHSGR